MTTLHGRARATVAPQGMSWHIWMAGSVAALIYDSFAEVIGYAFLGLRRLAELSIFSSNTIKPHMFLRLIFLHDKNKQYEGCEQMYVYSLAVSIDANR